MNVKPVTLDESLAKKISGLFEREERTAREIAAIAAEIRSAHFDGPSKKYSKAFRTFWGEFNLKAKFGSQSNFTKYAYAHEAVERAKRFGATEEALPGSLKALYAMSQLDDNELQLCVEDTWSRSEVTDDRALWTRVSAEPKPLIQPDATEKEIKAWHKNWRYPTARSGKPQRVKLVEISISSLACAQENAEQAKKVRTFLDNLQELQASLGDNIVEVKLSEDALGRLDPSYGAERDGRRQEERKAKSLDRKIDGSFERALRKPGEYVPWSERALLLGLFDNVMTNDIAKKRPTRKEKEFGRIYDTVVVSPTFDQFLKLLGQKYLEKHGARRFLALIYRCKGSGHWARTEYYEIKKNGKWQSVMGSPLEQELIQRRKMLRVSKQARRGTWGDGSTIESLCARIEELENLISPRLDSMSDHELLMIAREWCGLPEIRFLTYQAPPTLSATTEKAEAAWQPFHAGNEVGATLTHG